MGKQSLTSVVRQVAAVLVTIYGILTASVSGLRLPPAVSAILVAVGPIILAIEHYVGDPSTGTPLPAPTPPAPATAPVTATTAPPGA